MKLSRLLSEREKLLQQVQLANTAHAFHLIRALAQRVAAVRLQGIVRLQSVDPDEDRYHPTLTAVTASQARLEEHFSDGEILRLADAVALALGSDFEALEFPLEDLAPNFEVPLRRRLEQAGVTLDLDPGAPVSPASENSTGTRRGGRTSPRKRLRD